MGAIDELDQKVDLLIQQYRSEKLRADKAEQQLAALQAERMEAIDLIRRAYQSGHREGWESGESVDECMQALRDFLDDAD